MVGLVCGHLAGQSRGWAAKCDRISCPTLLLTLTWLHLLGNAPPPANALTKRARKCAHSGGKREHSSRSWSPRPDWPLPVASCAPPARHGTPHLFFALICSGEAPDILSLQKFWYREGILDPQLHFS